VVSLCNHHLMIVLSLVFSLGVSIALHIYICIYMCICIYLGVGKVLEAARDADARGKALRVVCPVGTENENVTRP